MPKPKPRAHGVLGCCNLKRFVSLTEMCCEIPQSDGCDLQHDHSLHSASQMLDESDRLGVLRACVLQDEELSDVDSNIPDCCEFQRHRCAMQQLPLFRDRVKRAVQRIFPVQATSTHAADIGSSSAYCVACPLTTIPSVFGLSRCSSGHVDREDGHPLVVFCDAGGRSSTSHRDDCGMRRASRLRAQATSFLKGSTALGSGSEARAIASRKSGLGDTPMWLASCGRYW